jgi:hypothetical protein
MCSCSPGVQHNMRVLGLDYSSKFACHLPGPTHLASAPNVSKYKLLYTCWPSVSSNSIWHPFFRLFSSHSCIMLLSEANATALIVIRLDTHIVEQSWIFLALPAKLAGLQTSLLFCHLSQVSRPEPDLAVSSIFDGVQKVQCEAYDVCTCTCCNCCETVRLVPWICVLSTAVNKFLGLSCGTQLTYCKGHLPLYLCNSPGLHILLVSYVSLSCCSVVPSLANPPSPPPSSPKLLQSNPALSNQPNQRSRMSNSSRVSTLAAAQQYPQRFNPDGPPTARHLRCPGGRSNPLQRK